MFSFFKPKPPEIIAAPEASPIPEPAESRPGWAQRLKQGLTKTREKLGGQLFGLLGVGRKIDAELFDELETLLITADVGVEATQALLDTLQNRVRRENLTEATQLQTAPRAIGQACGSNPLPLVIPCHRVVSANGLGGFMHAASGTPLDIKAWLLGHEGIGDIAISGVPLPNPDETYQALD